MHLCSFSLGYLWVLCVLRLTSTALHLFHFVHGGDTLPSTPLPHKPEIRYTVKSEKIMAHTNPPGKLNHD